jgi:hypothetical protein
MDMQFAVYTLDGQTKMYIMVTFRLMKGKRNAIHFPVNTKKISEQTDPTYTLVRPFRIHDS